MTNMTIVYVNENTAQVTKAFMKKANTFGTDEFMRWREYKAMFPNAKMVTKTIKKNPEKKTTRNLTYSNMKEFLSTLPDGEKRCEELEIMKKRSHVQTCPYRFVLDWFFDTVEGYDNFKKFLAQKEAENEQTAEGTTENASEEKQFGTEVATTACK